MYIFHKKVKSKWAIKVSFSKTLSRQDISYFQDETPIDAVIRGTLGSCIIIYNAFIFLFKNFKFILLYLFLLNN